MKNFLDPPYLDMKEKILLNGNAIYIKYDQYYREFTTKLVFYDTDRELASFIGEDKALKFIQVLKEYGIRLVIKEKRRTRQLNNKIEEFNDEFRRRVEGKKG